MIANPYIYPHTPFKNLSNKTINWKIAHPETLSSKELTKIISLFNFPLSKIYGNTTDEKILNIFLDENILYGDPKNITQDAEMWLSKINFFTSKNKPIRFAIHGFPFKIPCPLKTERKDPDLGEMLAILKLKSIIESIKQVYKPGAVITIIGEGAFGKFVGVGRQEWESYHNMIQQLIKFLHLTKNIKIIDIGLIETDKHFLQVFTANKNKLKKLYERNDEEVVKKIEGTKDSFFRIVSTRNFDEKTLMDIYNEAVSNSQISQIRKKLHNESLEGIFNYHAYLLTRDELNFVQKQVPHSLPLSVSPKPNRLGVILVSPTCHILPYHGVPIVSKNKREFTIEYLIDLKREGKTLTPVYWEEDPEQKPFFYLTQG